MKHFDEVRGNERLGDELLEHVLKNWSTVPEWLHPLYGQLVKAADLYEKMGLAAVGREDAYMAEVAREKNAICRAFMECVIVSNSYRDAMKLEDRIARLGMDDPTGEKEAQSCLNGAQSGLRTLHEILDGVRSPVWDRYAELAQEAVSHCELVEHVVRGYVEDYVNYRVRKAQAEAQERSARAERNGTRALVAMSSIAVALILLLIMLWIEAEVLG